MRVRVSISKPHVSTGIPCVPSLFLGITNSPKLPGAVPDDFSGTWKHDPYDGINPARAKPGDKNFTLSDGTLIPLRREAEKLYRERVAMSATDNPFANTTSRCLPLGMSGDMIGGWPLGYYG